jgi:hypothetical protein
MREYISILDQVYGMLRNRRKQQVFVDEFKLQLRLQGFFVQDVAVQKQMSFKHINNYAGDDVNIYVLKKAFGMWQKQSYCRMGLQVGIRVT